ncbi:hypothetical protein K1T71_010604 [Dendrolimus kikuchii]|uniref:Uncharacterized protein n=1 Tax=Dendrolimus kikuchii TaxID=765133 RepID=A0ACC1CPL2_9NEOP|nr:hypothetical protein K1T71_010604 [Dendrolimus kikuchii]
MISSPWTTESWSSESGTFTEMTNSTSLLSLVYLEEDSFTYLTIEPRSSTSYGPPTPYFGTSITTFTILDGVFSPDKSLQIPPLTRKNTTESLDTFSSWTLETYTSSGWKSDSDLDIKINYPWSPKSNQTGTDFYPSSIVSPKLSKLTINTTDRELVTPIGYITLNGNKSESGLDRILIKMKNSEMLRDQV